MIGWLGLGLLLLAYVFMLSKWSWLFIPVDIIASGILTVHAIMIEDIPFIIVNGFITVILTVKYVKQGGNKEI